MTHIALPLVYAFGTTWITLLLLLGPWRKLGPLDQPNQRSLHQTPIPRSGGIALAVGVLAGWLLQPAGLPWAWLPGLLLLFVISLRDDYVGVAAHWRLLAHAISACLLLSSTPWAWYLPLWLLGIVWMINLYNFMDGMNGLAGGMAVIGFTACAVAAWFAGQDALLVWCGVIAVAAAAFLWFNFDPARVFLGDAGAIPLGFLVAATALEGNRTQAWPVWLVPLVFSPFIVDASITLAKRLWRRVPVWQAHREHYYQRLVQSGLGHRNTTLAEYVLMLLLAASALCGLSWTPLQQWLLVGAWILVYILLLPWLDRRWRKLKFTESHATHQL